MYKKLEFSESYEPIYKQKSASIANTIADSVARPLASATFNINSILNELCPCARCS